MNTQSSASLPRDRTEEKKFAFAQMQERLIERRSLLTELERDAAPHIDAARWAAVLSVRGTIGQITGALSRLESGAYGLCLSCGDALDPDRIEIFPYAESCVPCQKESEK
jgi:RNA polymerase-binding transcription factor DksA